MKKLTLLIVLAFIIKATVLSQPCLPEGIIFTTQEEIDNFQTNNPNCTTIEGDVEITGDEITNLNGLNVLTAIEGGLYIGNNAVLTSLTGLDNVTSIGKTLRIYMNAALTSLSGLDNVTSIGGNLRITSNAALTGLTGLDNVTSIVENLRIYMNAALTSLSGLDNVTSIGDNLRISSNAALTDLTALNNVTSIGGELGISENDALTGLAGLDNIDAGTITELSIYNNISLSTCEVKSVCNYLASPNGAIDIHDNAAGCNTQEEVVEACDAAGVPDINTKSIFSIYPNPAKKELFISSKNGVFIKEVNIYNQIGQKVLHENRITNMIDVSMLQQGMYVIELISNESKIREKLIIK
jgi:hypothetical protein